MPRRDGLEVERRIATEWRKVRTGLTGRGAQSPTRGRTCCPDRQTSQARRLRGLGPESGRVLVASSHGTLWTPLEDQPTPLKNASPFALEQRVHGRASAAQGHGERADIARAGRTAPSSCRRTRVWSISRAGRAGDEVRLACSFRRGRLRRSLFVGAAAGGGGADRAHTLGRARGDTWEYGRTERRATRPAC